MKAYEGTRPDGTVWKKQTARFGFKAHILVDARYELPIAYAVTDAAASDVAEGRKLLKALRKKRPSVIEKAEYLTGDKAYDCTDLILWLKQRGIKAVIDKRRMWREAAEKQLPKYEGAYYDEAGNVYCYSPTKGQRRMMSPNGYEPSRDAIRFKCPATAYGIECKEMKECRCKNVRVPLSADPRIFTQVPRSTYKWGRIYKKRTSVERVNSRLDVSFGFEERLVRGKARMTLHVCLALTVMQAMAVGHIVGGRVGLMRSLVRVA